MHPRDKVVRYHVHAKRRMRRRGITKEQVEATIRRPSAIQPAQRKGAKRFERKLSARKQMNVIAEEGSREFWIITAWK